jgi:acyl carrier protein
MLNNHTLQSYEIESCIHGEITNFLVESKANVRSISNEIKLNSELGMSSLELARLVSVLDDKLEVDPFIELVPITSVRTIGDLVNAYKKAFYTN